MKFKLESQAHGLILCHIVEALTKEEASQILQGIHKLLANGKSRIIVQFDEKAAGGEAGAAHIERSLRQQRELARKMGGDMKFVVAGAAKAQVPDAFPDLAAAVQSFVGQPEELIRGQETLRAEMAGLQSEIERLKAENVILGKKLEELLKVASKPSSDAELKQSAEHYKKLATEKEAPTAAGAGGAGPAKK